MFKYLLLLFSTIFFLVSQSTDSTSLLPVVKDCLYGFIDTEGKLVIDYQYRAVGTFAEGLAPVRTDGRYGYIDIKGKTIIDFIYDYATPFSNGLALTYADGCTKVIDQEGNVLYETNELKISLYAQNMLISNNSR